MTEFRDYRQKKKKKTYPVRKCQSVLENIDKFFLKSFVDIFIRLNGEHVDFFFFIIMENSFIRPKIKVIVLATCIASSTQKKNPHFIP